jgi:hypothetical protein
MSVLISLVVLVVVFALLYWLISSAPIPGPMAPTIKWALIAILVIFAVFYLLKFAGVALP